MTKSKIRFVNSYEKLLSLSIHNEQIWKKNTGHICSPLTPILNSPTQKFSLLYLMPDPGNGLPSFESLIQALSKNHMKGVG